MAAPLSADEVDHRISRAVHELSEHDRAHACAWLVFLLWAREYMRALELREVLLAKASDLLDDFAELGDAEAVLALASANAARDVARKQAVVNAIDRDLPCL